MRHNRHAATLRRCDYTGQPLLHWRTGPVWAERPMPWWRELLDALACAIKHAAVALGRVLGRAAG